LYNTVLQPIENNIKGKRLIIVPDGELNYIPFETLITEEPDTNLTPLNLSSLAYLVLQHPISYVYSASQFMDKHNTLKGKVRFAGFAPDYKRLYGEGKQDDIYKQLHILPGAYDEVLSAIEYFKGDLYTGEDIEKNQFFKANIRNDIVHLAMHTILDEDEPMNSELIISTNPDKVSPQLRAYEVYTKRNLSSLVVLSACNTGAGRLSEGEGVFSIARAFLLAGVRNVVLTHWPVADRSSAELMDRYYYYLSQGYPTDIALQRSKKDYLIYGDPVKAHPYYWAGYVNVGNPFEFPKRNNFWYLWIISIVAGVGLLYMVFRRRLKQS
jgi:CHAT domain-containing protein